MDEKYKTEIDDLRKKFENEMGTLSKTGGWDPDSHFHFQKIYKEYYKMRGMKPLLLERLSLEMPHRTPQALEVMRQRNVFFNHFEATLKLVSKVPSVL